MLYKVHSNAVEEAVEWNDVCLTYGRKCKEEIHIVRVDLRPLTLMGVSKQPTENMGFVNVESAAMVPLLSLIVMKAHRTINYTVLGIYENEKYL